MAVRAKRRGSRNSRRMLALLPGSMLIVVILFYASSSADQPHLSTELSKTLIETNDANFRGSHGTIASSVKETLSTKLLKSGVVSAETVWKDLIAEAAQLQKQKQSSPGIFMEVGMYRAHQCLQAAEQGLEAHCVEPSAANFARVKSKWASASPEIKNRMHLYNVAAGSVSGRKLQFHSGGGTGDRVGHVDVWKMEKEPAVAATSMTEVEEMRMDDIVLKHTAGAFAMKIDTQGFEPHVFTGLSSTLERHKAKYIILEYWPKGMDLMVAGNIGDCISAKVLHQLAGAGYRLYLLPVTAHPRAPAEWKVWKKKETLNQPLDDFVKNCQWYYNIESLFPSDEYKMGYWADILAVAPEAVIDNPITGLGKALL